MNLVSLIAGLLKLANFLMEWRASRKDFRAGETATLLKLYEKGAHYALMADLVDAAVRSGGDPEWVRSIRDTYASE